MGFSQLSLNTAPSPIVPSLPSFFPLSFPPFLFPSFSSFLPPSFCLLPLTHLYWAPPLCWPGMQGSQECDLCAPRASSKSSRVPLFTEQNLITPTCTFFRDWGRSVMTQVHNRQDKSFWVYSSFVKILFSLVILTAIFSALMPSKSFWVSLFLPAV